MQEGLNFKPEDIKHEDDESQTKSVEIKPIDPKISDEAKKQEEERLKKIKEEQETDENPQIKAEVIEPIDFRKKPEEEKE